MMAKAKTVVSKSASLFACTGTLLLLTGCGSSLPDCNDSAVKKQVTEMIVKNEIGGVDAFAAVFGGSKKNIKTTSDKRFFEDLKKLSPSNFKLSEVTINSVDEKTNKVVCDAVVEMRPEPANVQKVVSFLNAIESNKEAKKVVISGQSCGKSARTMLLLWGGRSAENIKVSSQIRYTVHKNLSEGGNKVTYRLLKQTGNAMFSGFTFGIAQSILHPITASECLESLVAKK